MCAHVFGCISFGGLNYVLHRTAVDSKAEFGEAAVSTLLNNFYVDDLLKSVGNINIAKQLVKGIISIYVQIWWFQPYKACLQQQGISEQHRVRTCQVIFPISGDLVNDRLHLGSTWFCSTICAGGENSSTKSLQLEFTLGYGSKWWCTNL